MLKIGNEFKQVIKEDLIDGTVLYNDSTGSNSSLTLSTSASNYSYVEIFYRSYFEVYNSVKIYNPNNKIFSMQCVWWRGEENKILAYVAQGLVFGTTITISNSGEFNIFASSAKGNANAGIFITKVVGYK